MLQVILFVSDDNVMVEQVNDDRNVVVVNHDDYVQNYWCYFGMMNYDDDHRWVMSDHVGLYYYYHDHVLVDERSRDAGGERR